MLRRSFVPAFLLAVTLNVAPCHAAVIGFDSARVSPDSSFTVSIVGSELIDLYSFNFDIIFNPSIVQLVSVTRGTIFDGLGLPCEACFFPGLTDSPGVVTFIADSLSGLVPGVDGTGVLALLEFRSSGVAGNAGLEFGLVEMAAVSPDGTTLVPIEDIGRREGEVRIESTPNPVPEPSTLALLGVGLAAMARKRLKKRPTA